MVVNNDVEASGVKEVVSHDHLFKVTGLSSTNLEKLAQDPGSDFEDAIAATGYGRFNMVLLLVTLPAFWSACSVTSAPSFIFTRAQCDMELSLLDMGTVSAMTYGGMMSSALLWGFLSDTLGRKSVMVWGFFTAGLVEITASLTQNFPMLLITRFFTGFLFNGPYATLVSYIAEVHRTDLRARLILLTGLFFTVANTFIPILAWAMLSNEWDFYLFGGKFVLHSWNLFLLANALMPILTGVVFTLMPESPKFLMSRGRNEEAMVVFKRIFVMNTGKPADEFPIKKLAEERTEQQGRGISALKGGFFQLKPLFKAPHLQWLLLICVIHAGFMFGNNTLRLWYPQLAAMISASEGNDLCSALIPSGVSSEGVAPQGVPPEEAPCVPLEPDMLTYLQSAVVGSGSLLTYSIGGAVINWCGKREVTSFCGISGALLVFLLPFVGNSSLSVMGIMTTSLAFTALAGAALSSICVDLFPTSLRVLALAAFLMVGRAGTAAGAVAFPALAARGCLPPFLAIAASLALCGAACFLIPNTTLKKLE